MKTVIFDIDGTLADASHRLHWVTSGSRDWTAFFSAMNWDTVVAPIRELLWHLQRDNKIVLCSGRPEDYRETTEIWLNQYRIDSAALYMRPAGDFRPDHVIKAELLTKMRDEGYEPWLAIDDRPSIVKMWRANGITCLQCRDWDEAPKTAPGLLTIMVGPSGAGKSTWLASGHARRDYGIRPEQVVSSDALREEMCGNFLSQERNDDVFAALHAIVKARIDSGLPAVVDATNLRTKDRRAVAALTSGPIRYIVVDRPMDQKRRDAGWRAELKGKDGEPFDLLAKHDQTFRSNLKDILSGDGLPNVSVVDMR